MKKAGRIFRPAFFTYDNFQADLQQRMLEYWRDRFTNIIVENPQFPAGDPAEGLLAALLQIRKDGLEAYELAIREWADRDPAANKIVQRVYQKRTRFLRRLFERMGFRGLQAEIRTRLTLCYLSWEPNMYPDESPSRRKKTSQTST